MAMKGELNAIARGHSLDAHSVYRETVALRIAGCEPQILSQCEMMVYGEHSKRRRLRVPPAQLQRNRAKACFVNSAHAGQIILSSLQGGGVEPAQLDGD